MRIEGQPAGPEPEATAQAGAAGAGASAAAPAGESCPQCGAEKTGMFCEACGFDYRSPAPQAQPVQAGPTPQPDQGASLAGSASTTNVVVTSGAPSGTGGEGELAATAGWTAVVTADRDYFDSVVAAGGPDAASIEFPSYCPERKFALDGQEVRIGRRSASRGLEPEIDLTGPPTDPGVSHLHAVLISQPDGTWAVLDPGSSNGTQVNGTDVATGVPVPLQPGDRVCLGAWTVLTIQQN